MLYVVATPIGNLGDITYRAVEVLKSVDLIIAEDTRVARKLLNHLSIKAPLESYHEHSTPAKENKILSKIKEGGVALISDAGTPAISDPGANIVARVRDEIGEDQVVVVPGPSAVTAAISISGIPSNQFTFLGFPPHKKGRNKFFKMLLEVSVWPVVIYESPHRLLKTLEALESLVGPDSQIYICSELTKIHEAVSKMTLSDAIARYSKFKAKGEFVIIIPK